jgi:hypothetical protein
MNNYKQALAKLKRINYGIIVKQGEDYTVIRCKSDKDIENITEEITLTGSIVAVKSGSQLYVLNGGA